MPVSMLTQHTFANRSPHRPPLLGGVDEALVRPHRFRSVVNHRDFLSGFKPLVQTEQRIGNNRSAHRAQLEQPRRRRGIHRRMSAAGHIQAQSRPFY